MLELINMIIPAKLRKKIFIIIYFILGFCYNVEFKHNTVLEFILGTILVELVILTTDFFIRHIAYIITNFIYTKENHNLDEKRASHWAFRVFALSVIIILTLSTRLPNILISSCVPGIALWIQSIFDNWCADFSNKIIDVFNT